MLNPSQWRERAASSLRAAQHLAKDASHLLAIANRAYYSIYQASVAEFVALGKKPTDFGPAHPIDADHWEHGRIENNLRACPRTLQLGKDFKTLYKELRSYRQSADYGCGDPPEFADLLSSLSSLHGALKKLGACT